MLRQPLHCSPICFSAKKNYFFPLHYRKKTTVAQAGGEESSFPSQPTSRSAGPSRFSTFCPPSLATGSSTPTVWTKVKLRRPRRLRWTHLRRPRVQVVHQRSARCDLRHRWAFAVLFLGHHSRPLLRRHIDAHKLKFNVLPAAASVFSTLILLDHSTLDHIAVLYVGPRSRPRVGPLSSSWTRRRRSPSSTLDLYGCRPVLLSLIHI